MLLSSHFHCRPYSNPMLIPMGIPFSRELPFPCTPLVLTLTDPRTAEKKGGYGLGGCQEEGLDSHQSLYIIVRLSSLAAGPRAGCYSYATV